MNTPPFPPSSRYGAVPTETHRLPDGRTVVYLRRRFLPSPERFALLRERIVHQGERLDTISAEVFGDPEQFWRICDANGVLRPEDLTEEPGSRIRITLPEGVPGTPHA